MALTDLLDAGLPWTLPFVKSAVSVKNNKDKHNKMRYACVCTLKYFQYLCETLLTQNSDEQIKK